MNTSRDIIQDLKVKTARVLEAFNLGQLTLPESFYWAAKLDKESSEALWAEYSYLARGEN
jgi:hypothetical protein